MSHDVGVWIDHKKAVIVLTSFLPNDDVAGRWACKLGHDDLCYGTMLLDGHLGDREPSPKQVFVYIMHTESGPDQLVLRSREEAVEREMSTAQRLCGVEGASCKTALDALAAERFLCFKPDGSYARLTDGPNRAHPAKARLSPDRSSHEPLFKSAS